MKTKKPELRLYVWDNFNPDYTEGLAFAIAGSEKEARKLIEQDRGFPVSDWGPLCVRPLNQRYATSVSGGG